jgi:hypothetical protein
MFRLGHPRQLLQGGLCISIGQIIVDFHALVLLAIAVASHRQPLLLAWLTPVVSGKRHAV